MLPEAPEFPEGVVETSPSHGKIVVQAQRAEANGLGEIAGLGYRKALEFLVKDYCIRKSPTKEAEIRKKPLGSCIQEDIADTNIRECARRAAWLGNDETHYERVWTGHDISDLKLLIRLTQNWISNEYLTEKYLNELQKGKEPSSPIP